MNILYLHRNPVPNRHLWRSVINKDELTYKMRTCIADYSLYSKVTNITSRWGANNDSGLFAAQGMYELAMAAQESFTRNKT